MAASPAAEKRAGAFRIGHGIEDLSPEERARYEAARVIERPPRTVVEQQYVAVPERDYLAEGFRQALAGEVRSNGHYRPLAERVETMARHIAESLRTSERMAGRGRRSSDIVVQHGD